MIKDIEAVIFDLDGTLIDSMWMWKQIDIEYLDSIGHKCPEDIQKGIEGMSFTQTAQYFKARFNIPETIEEIKAVWNGMAYDKYANQVPFKEGALEFVKSLREMGIKTGIATSNSIELVTVVMETHNAGDYFDEIHTSCEVKEGKPSPDIYLLVAERLNVSCDKCLVFEDVPAGIMAGKRAGMKVCAVYDDYSKDYDLEKKQMADYYINSFKELI